MTDNSRVNFPMTIRGTQDEGPYRYTAKNGVGRPLTKDVNMTIHCKCCSDGCYDYFFLPSSFCITSSYNKAENSRMFIRLS